MTKPAWVIGHRNALKLADKHRPTFIQYFQDLRDLITPIHFGQFIPTAAPVIYFSAKEDEGHGYILYCVFHRKDWSSKGGIFGHLDTHEYDLEGALLVIDSWMDTVVACASIFHNQIKFAGGWSHDERPIFSIQAQGHGITPWTSNNPDAVAAIRLNNSIAYVNYDLVDINESRVHEKFFGVWKKEFKKHGVHTPDEWGYVSKMGVKSKGLIYTDPARLINMAKRRKLF